MKNMCIKLLISLGIFLTWLNVSFAEELTSESDSIKLVEILSSETLDILTSDITQPEKEKLIRAILVENLDIERIGTLIAGKAINKASDEQIAEYNPLIRDYIEIKYSKLLGGYDGQTIEIVSSGRVGKSDALVNTQIVKEGSVPVLVSWRVSNQKEKLLVLDVIVEGISMLRTERSQFEAVLQTKTFEGLIETLEKKVTEMSIEG